MGGHVEGTEPKEVLEKLMVTPESMTDEGCFQQLTIGGGGRRECAAVEPWRLGQPLHAVSRLFSPKIHTTTMVLHY